MRVADISEPLDLGRNIVKTLKPGGRENSTAPGGFNSKFAAGHLRAPVLFVL
jgi:hypothetical protein